MTSCARILSVVMCMWGGEILLLSPAPCFAARKGDEPSTAQTPSVNRERERETSAEGYVETKEFQKTKYSYTTESQGLRMTVILDEPAKWFVLENGMMSLREPSPDENLGVVVRFEDASSGVFYPAATVKGLIWDAAFRQCLVTTTTLTPVWNGREIEFFGNFFVPFDDDEKREVSLELVVEPPAGIGRSTNVAETFFRERITAQFGPIKVSRKIVQATLQDHQRRPAAAKVPGRHPPLEPTPYPGTKTHSNVQNNR
ncbi:MAG: hypothetical protein N2Z21_11160 [Candidatus Sumerlaeaceae bacterium]|nr:hypothetical protein [Candidatus Sumerlaeaceae bacterium]